MISVGVRVGQGLFLPVLPEGQPDAEADLGQAEEAHVGRVVGEEAGYFAGACGAGDPEKRVLPRGEERYYPVADGCYGKGLFKPLRPHDLSFQSSSLRSEEHTSELQSRQYL